MTKEKNESSGKKCQSKRAINAADIIYVMQPGENKDLLHYQIIIQRWWKLLKIKWEKMIALHSMPNRNLMKLKGTAKLKSQHHFMTLKES